MNKFEKGKKGELMAVRYLKNSGYSILETNFRSRFGEIDIVGQTDGEIVFVEVKYLDKLKIDALEYALNYNKRKRIIETAKYFMFLKPDYRRYKLRFDVVFLCGKTNEIRHMKSAFNGVV